MALSSRPIAGASFVVASGARSLSGAYAHHGMMPAAALALSRPSTAEAGGAVPCGRTKAIKTADLDVEEREVDNQVNMYSGRNSDQRSSKG